MLRLADGRLLSIFRVQACQSYWKSYSHDGVTWTPPAALPFGSARPKLRLLADGKVLLSGGRPGLFLWVGDADAENWSAYNLASVHNRQIDAHGLPTSWKYSEAFVNSSTAETYVIESTAYTSLLDLGQGQMLVTYDRLANGWRFPPGRWGDGDHTFSLRFRYSAP